MADSALERKAAGAPSLLQWARHYVRKYGWGYVFVLPSMITFAIFTFLPVVWSLIISFQQYSLRTGGKWVGFANYTAAWTTQGGVFVTALRNTLLYIVITVIANILIGLILASLIQ